MMAKIKNIQNDRTSKLRAMQEENLRRHLDLHPELKEAHEARQWAKVGLESFEDDTVSYEDSWQWQRPGYHRSIGADGEGCWVADTPDMERQRALKKTLTAQGMPDEVIETVLWVANEVAKESANELHAQQPKPKPKPKRKSGGGRKPSIEQDQIKKGIRILRSHDEMTVKDARRKLRDEGIEGGDSALSRLTAFRNSVSK
jgi:hypothetical protein